MMIDESAVKFWQKFARSWILDENTQNEIRPTRGDYNYISIHDEIMNLDDEEFDDDDID